jgi:RNA polymerase sigma-70 factor (ECF subfamily)
VSPVETHAGGVTARLTRLIGDFDLAEELVQDAIVAALEHWPREGNPDTPAAWLLTGSPVVLLNRAIALREVAGPEAALREADHLADDLSGYYLFHATRAELLRDLGRADEARHADRRALDLTDDPAERALLVERISGS